MGSSGAGKTTLVARLSERPGYAVRVVNDDWGAVSVHSGVAVNTGEINLHMKTGSILALRPDFFARAAPDEYMYDISESDPSSRLLAAPESVYETRWDRRSIVIDNVVVIVREPTGWDPPRQFTEVLRFLGGGGYDDYFRQSEPFFNGSLILRTDAELTREVTRYETLLNRVSLSWINNCGTVGELTEAFVRAVMGGVD